MGCFELPHSLEAFVQSDHSLDGTELQVVSQQTRWKV